MSDLPDYSQYQMTRNGIAGTINKKWRKAVVLGRFQPLHNEHVELIKGAFTKAETVHIVIGSCDASPSFQNPFSYEMRKDFIQGVFPKEIKEGKLTIEGMPDYTYRDKKWYSEFTRILFDNGSVWYTFAKDASTKDYIDGVPKTACIRVFHEAKNPDLNATDVRTKYFDGLPAGNLDVLPMYVRHSLHRWSDDPVFEQIAKEWGAVKEYRKLWTPLKTYSSSGTILEERNPFPVQFMAVDALVTWHNRWGQPHVLVGVRKSEFGNGKLCIPGGYLDANEKCIDGAKRELREETGLVVDDGYILDQVHIVDDPKRSLRGRMVTFVHKWRCCEPKMPKLTPGDDLSDCFWMPVDDIHANKQRFFSDHYYIISKLIEVENLDA